MSSSYLDHEYFEDKKVAKAFSCALSTRVKKRMEKVIESFVSKENVQRFRHGGDWKHPANPSAFNGGIQAHSVEGTTPFEDIVNNDLESIERGVTQLADGMTKEFVESMYSMISDSCASVGNVVQSRENAPIWELFYEALEKIELVVGINGEVEMPQIHVGEKAFEDLKNSIANAPPDFTQKLDELKAKKRDEAYAREAARRAKFARYGDEE